MDRSRNNIKIVDKGGGDYFCKVFKKYWGHLLINSITASIFTVFNKSLEWAKLTLSLMKTKMKFGDHVTMLFCEWLYVHQKQSNGDINNDNTFSRSFIALGKKPVMLDKKAGSPWGYFMEKASSMNNYGHFHRHAALARLKSNFTVYIIIAIMFWTHKDGRLSKSTWVISVT